MFSPRNSTSNKFFQQFELKPKIFFTFEYKGDYYAIAAIPTGAAGAPVIAQARVRSICREAIRRTTGSCESDSITYDTCIDNIRILTNDYSLLATVWHNLLTVLREVGITIGKPATDARRSPLFDE